MIKFKKYGGGEVKCSDEQGNTVGIITALGCGRPFCKHVYIQFSGILTAEDHRKIADKLDKLNG